tara:strand:+ start:833 stop:1930 length:1098 start_codon:yes stop_codon:yes gene_type:complete
LNQGGAEKSLYKLLSNIDNAKNHSVISLLPNGYYENIFKKNLNVDTYSLYCWRGKFGYISFGFLGLAKLIKLVYKIKPDVIMGWMYHGNLVATISSFLLPKRKVIWNIRQSLYKNNREKFFTRLVINLCRYLQFRVNKIIYNSSLSKIHHENIGYKSSLGTIIYNGFDSCFLDTKIRKKIKKELQIEDSKIVIGHVARYHHMKDHANFLQAILRVLKIRNDLCIVLIGRDVNLNNKEISKEIPIDYRKYFKFLNEKNDAQFFMHSFDFLCLSSLSESFPNVIAEAMSIGIPVVSTDVGDAKYLIGDSGITVPAENPIALHEGINGLLDMGKENRINLGLEAQKRINSKFSLLSYCDNYKKIILKL